MIFTTVMFLLFIIFIFNNLGVWYWEKQATTYEIWDNIYIISNIILTDLYFLYIFYRQIVKCINKKTTFIYSWKLKPGKKTIKHLGVQVLVFKTRFFILTGLLTGFNNQNKNLRFWFWFWKSCYERLRFWLTTHTGFYILNK